MHIIAKQPRYVLEPVLFHPVEQDGCTISIVLLFELRLIKLLQLTSTVFWWMYIIYVCEEIGQFSYVRESVRSVS